MEAKGNFGKEQGNNNSHSHTLRIRDPRIALIPFHIKEYIPRLTTPPKIPLTWLFSKPDQLWSALLNHFEVFKIYFLSHSQQMWYPSYTSLIHTKDFPGQYKSYFNNESGATEKIPANQAMDHA